MTTFNVTDAATLTTALGSAVAADEIVLADGSYGVYTISNADGITVRGGTGAVFTRLSITACGDCVFRGFAVRDKSAADTATPLVQILATPINTTTQVLNLTIEGADRVAPDNVTVRATRDGEIYTSYRAMLIGDISGGADRNDGTVIVAGCRMTHVFDGIRCFGNEKVSIINNYIDFMTLDFISFGNITSEILIQDNWGARERWPGDYWDGNSWEPYHTDNIQGQAGTTGNVVIRGNFSPGQTVQKSVQGVFIDDGTFANVLMEQNCHIGGYLNGLKVESGVASNVWAWRNTSLTPVSWGAKAAQITGGVGSGTKIGNVEGWNNNNKSLTGDNIVLQTDEPTQSGYYSDYYANVTGPTGQLPADFRWVDGSLTDPNEATHYGAAERIREILDGTSFTYPAIPFAFSLDPSQIDAAFVPIANPYGGEGQAPSIPALPAILTISVTVGA